MNSVSESPGCRVCNSPTIRAHLIPRAFARDMRKGGSDLRMGSIDQTGYTSSKSGVFDDAILCADCDGKLGVLDDYAVTFCRRFEDERVMIKEPNRSDMFFIDSVDTDKLVRFAASVCWRHSISKRHEASTIQLGPFERQFQAVSFGETDVALEPALIIWANQTKNIDIKKLAFSPTMHRQYGLRFCSMILGGVSFVLKVDRRPLPSAVKLLAVNGKTMIVSGYKPFDGSYESHEMMKIVRNMTAARARSHRPPAAK